MNKFKVGDLIKGTVNGAYTYTNQNMTKGIVVEVHNDVIEVKVLENKMCPQSEGRTYNVLSKYFKFYQEEDFNKRIVKIINAPSGAKGVENTTGILIDETTAELLLKNDDFSYGGLSKYESEIYFIPFKGFYNSSISGELWGLGYDYNKIQYVDIVTGIEHNKQVEEYTELTVSEIEEKLGYKIKVISDKEN